MTKEDWMQMQKLLPSDSHGYMHFGYCVSIDGDYVIIGAPEDSDNGDRSGTAYIFKHDGNSWNEQAKLLASDGDEGDEFGHSVSIDDDYAIISAHLDNDNGRYSGSAYIFKRDGSNWIQQAKLLSSDGEEWDRFGCSVSICGDDAIFGAEEDDDNGESSGSAYFFKRIENQPPIADISSIMPNPAANYQGNILIGPDKDTITFDVSESYDPDPGGYITEYKWHSDIVGDLGYGKIITKNDLPPSVHHITLTVTDNEGETDSTDAYLTVVDGLVFRPDESFECPSIEYEKENEPSYNKPVSDCETGFIGVYSESRLSFNSAEGGQYIIFDVHGPTFVKLKTKLVTISKTAGLFGGGSTMLRLYHARPSESDVFPPYDGIDSWLCENHMAELFEDSGDWDDWLSVVLSWLSSIPGVGTVANIIQGLLILKDLLVTGMLDAETLRETLYDNGGEDVGAMASFKVRRGVYHPNGNELTLNIAASSGGVYAKASRFSLMEYITIEETDSGPSNLKITALCPVDLIVTDPTGRYINKSYSQIPNSNYTEEDIFPDGDLDDQIFILDPLDGEYSIEVIAEEGADPDDNFSLLINHEGGSFWFAQDVNISNIPQEPYVFSTYRPEKPTKPTGRSSGRPGKKYTFRTSSVHPDGDQLYYLWDWGDGNFSDWLGPFNSGNIVEASHIWDYTSIFKVRVRSSSDYDVWSNWSDPLSVTIPRDKTFNSNFNFLEWLFERFPNAFPILRQLLGL